MARRRPETKRHDKSENEGTKKLRSGESVGTKEPVPLDVHYVDAECLMNMMPGDIILLSEAESLKDAVEPEFVAVLACPKCGTLHLISSAQYLGVSPVVCQSKLCSCRFRIVDQYRLVYLPLN